MRKLGALGAPLALFGFLFQLLLPVTTAVAHQFDSDIPQVEICSRVGLKQLPATLADLVVVPAGQDSGQTGPDQPASQAEYCPGTASGALAPDAPAAPGPASPFILAGPYRADQAAPALHSGAPGLGPRGPPAST